MTKHYDIAIIGGGINGCGCAADAAQRGLSVFLCDKNDLASATSSQSSKLIHGGLRYLEHWDISLVKKALDERQRLLNIAPHLVEPLPFVVPHLEHHRSAWMIRTGLFLYDHLSRMNQLPHSQRINRKQHAAYLDPVTSQIQQGFLFYDCRTNDARLTITNALQAQQHGADIQPQTRLVSAHPHQTHWQLMLEKSNGQSFDIEAKVLINATGPWAEQINQLCQIPSQHHLSLVKGSHILVPRLYEGSFAYLLQHDDHRIVFVIPYAQQSLIGTTEVAFHGSLDQVQIDDSEIDYLLNLTNLYFKQKLNRSHIRHTWSGVRPLIAAPQETPSALSREYLLDVQSHPAPALTIYGGKITTYRTLAEEAIDHLQPFFSTLPPSHTKETPLPGATHHHMTFHDYQHHARKTYPWLPEEILIHYLKTYGTRTESLLASCHTMDDLGQAFSKTCFSREIDFLKEQEWASHSEDILWRRTLHGFDMTLAEQQALQDYMLLNYSSALP